MWRSQQYDPLAFVWLVNAADVLAVLHALAGTHVTRDVMRTISLQNGLIDELTLVSLLALNYHLIGGRDIRPYDMRDHVGRPCRAIPGFASCIDGVAWWPG